MPENPGRTVAVWRFPHHSNSGHPFAALAATIYGFPSVVSYYSLGRRFHCSVPVKHGGHVKLCRICGRFLDFLLLHYAVQVRVCVLM